MITKSEGELVHDGANSFSETVMHNDAVAAEEQRERVRAAEIRLLSGNLDYQEYCRLRNAQPLLLAESAQDVPLDEAVPRDFRLRRERQAQAAAPEVIPGKESFEDYKLRRANERNFGNDE